jgi:hypothetical protein
MPGGQLTCDICEIWIGRYRSELKLPLSSEKVFHFLWTPACPHGQIAVINALSLSSCLPTCLFSHLLESVLVPLDLQEIPTWLSSIMEPNGTQHTEQLSAV